jgi:NAD(P)H-hydrate repair Nnr-like enzyme with NAD(P)H-hydrate epimerase domain
MYPGKYKKMKLFTTKQIAELDKYTIENEPVTDVDLMERASLQITGWLVNRFSTENKMIFFVGPGNNGGDALAIARQMADLDFQCEVYLLDLGKPIKGSPAINWQRLDRNREKSDSQKYLQLMIFLKLVRTRYYYRWPVWFRINPSARWFGS